MLYDTLTPEQVVDSEAALEFMKEATKLASAEELEDIGWRLERKSAAFRELVAPERLHALDEATFARLLGWIFSLRRKAKRLVRANGIERLRLELAALLENGSSPGERLDRFLARVEGLEPPLVLALATEVLHFSDPRRYWLWTHWIWDPAKGTGALALVTHDEIDFTAATPGAAYMSIGRGTALVHSQAQGIGYGFAGRGLFGTDVFLACVYAVYMYTVFRVRLSQEFNRILPELPELVQRVLGVHRIDRMGETGAR